MDLTPIYDHIIPVRQEAMAESTALSALSKYTCGNEGKNESTYD